jgi:hypothetical protein
MLNSSQHLHQARRASGASNAFFQTGETTPSKVLHNHQTFFGGVVLYTLWIPGVSP